MMSRVGKSWAWTMVQAFLTATLICLLYWAWLVIRSPDNFPVRNLKIVAPGKQVSEKAIEAIILKNFQGGFFSFKASAINQALLNDPWLASVSLRRIWPDTVELTVTEKTAILEWNSAQLVDVSGHLFQPPVDTFPKNLPQLFGPENNFKDVYSKYQRYTAALNTLNLSIKNLKESERLSWSIDLNNNIAVVLGERNPDVRFDRFVAHYQKLIGAKAPCVDYVDLRYPDGMTIKWKNLDKNQQCQSSAVLDSDSRLPG